MEVTHIPRFPEPERAELERILVALTDLKSFASDVYMDVFRALRASGLKAEHMNMHGRMLDGILVGNVGIVVVLCRITGNELEACLWHSVSLAKVEAIVLVMTKDMAVPETFRGKPLRKVVVSTTLCL